MAIVTVHLKVRIEVADDLTMKAREVASGEYTGSGSCLVERGIRFGDLPSCQQTPPGLITRSKDILTALCSDLR